jgi:hypothetical protein
MKAKHVEALVSFKRERKLAERDRQAARALAREAKRTAWTDAVIGVVPLKTRS